MKKKQRCLLNRFAALVAVLMLCASLCVPCFASNNASTQKWYVAGESNLVSESGAETRYLRLTPYVGGQEYTYNCTTLYTRVNVQDSYFEFLTPINYPDWWRSDLPIGNLTYVNFELVSNSYSYTLAGGYTPITSGQVYFCDLSQAVHTSIPLTSPSYSSGSYYGGDTVYSSSVPSFCIRAAAGNGGWVSATSFTFSVAKPSTVAISNLNTLALTAGGYYYPNYQLSFIASDLSMLTSDNFVPCIVFPSAVSGNTCYFKSTFKLSFWVDANKLPAGLQVGDEFPANDDAFHNLRDELLKQFPEASENVKNGKATIEGWNDTETVDTDVASTSISALNALFQNLGGFLFIVSLMVFGAVVLRMLIRKAVDG